MAGGILGVKEKQFSEILDLMINNAAKTISNFLPVNKNKIQHFT